MRSRWKLRRIQWTLILKKFFLLKKGSGMTFLPIKISKDITLKPKSQNGSWDRYAIMIKTREIQTALLNQWVQDCEKRLGKLEGTNSRNLIGFCISIKEATKLGSSNAKNPDTLVGTRLRLSWWGHVAVPFKWNEFLFHPDCSYDVTSILKSWLIAGERESKKEGKPSSQLSTHSGTVQTKQNLAMTYRSREKYTTTASGSLVRTPTTGSI